MKKSRSIENIALQIQYNKMRFQENPEILRECHKRGLKKGQKDEAGLRIPCKK